MINNRLTYVSLFSSAGVGCYGFKQEGFECIATNELIEKRLRIQKLNNKCKYESGYINGDITKIETKDLIFSEIEIWHKEGNDKVDVLIATPPCQGMSVANHKKSDTEIVRNSLVVESIEMVKQIRPRFFVFENVPAFLKTLCTIKGVEKPIGAAIIEELARYYHMENRVINFKNYGSNSSRTRTLVIGVSHELGDLDISPESLFPIYREDKPLREVIGHLPKLEWGEISNEDFYHNFRVYKEEMRPWIHNLKEGESAFDNADDSLKPHKIVDGKIVVNTQKNGDKYKRQYWCKVAPCIHTRTDIFSSQNTVHPEEDRVFSIRELMLMMSIPESFKWVDKEMSELNNLSIEEKRKLLKKEELNIRQSIGEAVPTGVFREIAKNIKDNIMN